MWKLDGFVELMDYDEMLTVARQGRDPSLDVVYVAGVPRAAHPPAVFTIPATWQPAGGRDLQLLPEAFREREACNFWQPHYEGEGAPQAAEIGDVVFRAGKSYQVNTAENWGSYTKCLVTRIDVSQAAYLDGSVLPPPIYPEL